MKTAKKFIKAITTVCILSAAVSCGQNESATQNANASLFKVQFFIGNVKISGERGEVSAKQGDILSINDVIKTGGKSYVDILYASSGVIRINENSSVSIAAIPDNENNSTILGMEKGKLFVALSKLKKNDFNVKTSTLVAAVRGTSFSVVSDKAGSKVSVLKGTVSARPVKKGNVIEEKAADIHENFKTDYINEAAVDKITAGKEIATVKMTDAETTEFMNEANDIKENIDKISELSPQEKENIEKEMRTTDTPHDPQKAKAARIAAAKKAAEKKRREAAAKKAKEEKTKKERVSNIPTM
ncbi:MAG: FecR domain-containing protein [Leptospirales bacterium]|nr:FecR domain-containing protein [Leptospirales bacterium]